MRFNGPMEAIKLLQGLSSTEQKNLIELLKQRDPKIAKLLEQHLVSIEDIKKLTPKMVQSLMTKVDIDVLGLALRGTSSELQEFIKKSLSSRMVKDIDEILNGVKRKLSDVEEARNEVVTEMKKKIEKGEIVLSDDSEEYV